MQKARLLPLSWIDEIKTDQFYHFPSPGDTPLCAPDYEYYHLLRDKHIRENNSYTQGYGIGWLFILAVLLIHREYRARLDISNCEEAKSVLKLFIWKSHPIVFKQQVYLLDG